MSNCKTETRNLQGHPLSQQGQHQAQALQTAVGSSSQDPYAVPSPLALAPPPSAPAGNVNFESSFSMTDAAVRYMVERCMSDVRAADKKARQLIKVEIAAKQLALEILQYEKIVAGEDHEAHGADAAGQPVQDPAGDGTS